MTDAFGSIPARSRAFAPRGPAGASESGSGLPQSKTWRKSEDAVSAPGFPSLFSRSFATLFLLRLFAAISLSQNEIQAMKFSVGDHNHE
jgi:hypothetical protein